MTEKNVEALVIGGGPAGCSAAIALAQRGVKVRLCEAKTYPQAKVCGEFLSPECTGLLEALGLGALLAEQGAVPISLARLTAADGTSWETQLPATAWGFSRQALDAALAQHARQQGVALYEATTVTQLAGDLTQGFEVETRTTRGTQARFKARVVIAAHGKRSGLDRVWRRDFFEQAQPFIALKTHWRGSTLSQRVELHAFPGGYCGLAEVENGLINVCLLVHEQVFQARFGRTAANLQQFINWMRSQNIHLEARFSESQQLGFDWLSIGQVPFVNKHPMTGDVLMAGDAAGLITPLAGDGIAMALHSGRLAAEACLKYLAGRLSAPELRRCYPAAWQREFGRRLQLGRVLQACMLRPYLFSPMLRLVTTFPALGRFFVTHTRASMAKDIV